MAGRSRVAAIVNPAAGRRRGAELRARARDRLRQLFPGLTIEETEGPGHAAELARRCSGFELVIIVGGDGTVREVACGLVHSPADIAVVPVGSGNDFCRTLGIPADVDAACCVARDGAARVIDIARLVHDAGRKLFVNAAGFGFDAQVVAETRRLSRLRGLPLYLAAVLRAVRRYECPVATIRTDGREWRQPVLLIAAANGRYYGGGMRIAPDALPDDGRLDVCIIDAVGRLTILRRLPRFVRGTHGKLPEVTFLRTPDLELEFARPVPLQLDGDLVDPPPSGRIRIEVVPRALRVVVPRAAQPARRSG